LNKTLIFEQNFDYWPKLWFLTKISIFDQNFVFWPKLWFLNKTLILNQNLDFSSKLWFLTKTLIFWAKVWFLTKTLIFDQNFDFGPKFPYLTKISIFDQNFDFWPKFLFLLFLNIFYIFDHIFQFNASFLLELHDSAVASDFGNFLADCESERKQSHIKNKTYSIWRLFNAEKYINPLYEVPQPTPAWPLGPCDLWRQYWCRYQSESTTNTADVQMEALQHLVMQNRQSF